MESGQAMTAAQEKLFFVVGASVALCAEALVMRNYGALVG